MADTSLIFKLFAEDKTESGLKSVESRFSSMKSIMGGILGAEAVNGIKDFFGESVNLAEQAMKVGQQTAAILASTGNAAHLTAGQVQELADKYGELAGVESTQVQNGLNTVLRAQGVQRAMSLGVLTADDLTGTLVNLSAAMSHGGSTADSLSSAASTLGKALADPFAASKALKAAGDPLTAQQTQLMADFKKTGNEAGAYKLVLDQLKGATAGAAAANTTPLERLRVKWDDIKKTVGQQLIPALEHFATVALGALGPLVSGAQAFGGFVRNNVGWIGALVGGIGAVYVAVQLVAFATKLWGAAQKLVAEAFWAINANPLLIIAAVVIGLAIKFKGFRDFLFQVFTDIAKVVAGVAGFIWDVVSKVIVKILDLASHIPFVGDKFRAAADGVRAFTGEVDNAIAAVENFNGVAAGDALFNSLTNMLKIPSYSAPKFSSAGVDLGGALGAGLGAGLGKAAPAVKTAAQTLADNVMKGLQDFKNKIVQSFGNMGSLVANAMVGPPGANFLVGNLQQQLNKAKQFVADIATLRKFGLNATSLNELIAAGPDRGADAARQLATTGLGSIGQINSLESQFNQVGNAFADKTASAEFGSSMAAAKRNVVYLNIDMAGSSTDDLMKALRKAIRVKGGNVQTVLGGAA